AAQATVLGPHASKLHQSVASLSALSDGVKINCVIFANELLDALPTHAVAMNEDGLREVFIDVRDGQFTEVFAEPSSPRIAESLARAGARLAPGWRAEVNLAAEDWVTSAAQTLGRGFLVIIDYGHDEAEVYG